MALLAQTILERNRLFHGLPAATVQRVTALVIRRIYKAGAVVFTQGGPGDALYGVVSGRIRISSSTPNGKEMFLNIMQPGDTFGEIALLDGKPRTATATATAPAELMIIGRTQFVALLYQEPTIVTHVLELLCQRLRWTSGWVEDAALLGASARIARRLLSLARLHGEKLPGGAARLVISQEEMARFLGLSRQVVNQRLQDWKARDWVHVGRNQITVVDEDALERVAGRDEP